MINILVTIPEGVEIKRPAECYPYTSYGGIYSRQASLFPSKLCRAYSAEISCSCKA